ncbi:DUF7260 family protein [Natronomonas gomsonensis]|uniref:DUF7260 family protein n=1 Tax=Natronomonas gomsonensis TaxID=1046043 RepID=UPI0020CA81CB|nr:hypothetical protein [Natronomonas gomsonensis]
MAHGAVHHGTGMTTACEILDRAVECIEEETQSLQRERQAFETFRKSVSRAQPATGDGGTQTGSLLEIYQETVMSTPDFEVAYDEPVSESLKSELSPSIAETLQQNEPITQHFKRNLLLATTEAIESRVRFIRVLEAEQESIRAVLKTVLEIEDTLQELPVCTLRCLQFEQFVDVWEACEETVERCDQRSEQRQRHINERRSKNEHANVGAHALNAYLYSDLKTQFPALRALSEKRQEIEQYRGEATKPVSHTREDNCDSGLEATSN